MKKPLVIYLVDTVEQIKHLNLFNMNLVNSVKAYQLDDWEIVYSE